MTAPYRTLAGPAQAELEISRSRFLSLLTPVPDEDGARAAIARARAEHPRARHHCTAFVIGPGSELQRTNDDGEPSGTAGAPMLEALLAGEVSDVVAVVVRYFGGVLLGTGGLTRAYRGAVVAALGSASYARREERTVFTVRTTYPEAAALEGEARRRAWGVEASYGEQVELALSIPPAAEGELAARVAEITAGRTTAELTSRGWVTWGAG